MKVLAAVLLFCSFASAQMLQTISNDVTHAGAGVSPGFVNDVSFNSITTPGTSGTYQVTTRQAGTVTCQSFADCIPTGDGILSGNLAIAMGMFNRSTTVTPTATDGTNTYTCVTGGTATSSNWPYFCYKTAATATTNQVTVTIGSATTTNVVGRFEQFYNISALDGSVQSCGATTTTTPGCVSVTTTAANDLVIALFCPVSTPGVSSFTPGTGFTSLASDLQTGCQAEWKVASSAGSVTPSATWGNSTSYIEMVAAFTATTSGTAPSGRYLAHMMSYSNPEFATLGSLPVKFPSIGNLLAATHAVNASGGMSFTSMSDSVNGTWTTNTAYTGQQNTMSTSYVINAAANSTGNVTMVFSGNGDTTETLYDFVGMPTTLNVARGESEFNGEEFSSGTYTAFISHTLLGVSNPFPTDGVSLIAGGTGTNTFLSINAPTGCHSSMSTQGGEALSGPWAVDQNNPFAYCYFTAAPAGSVPTFTMTSSSTDPGPTNLETTTFYGTAGVSVVNSKYISGSGTSLETTALPSTTSGNLFVVNVIVFNSTARTISKVCLGGNTTCSAGTQLTQCTSCVSTGSGHGATSVWYTTSVPSAQTKLDIVPSATASSIEAAAYEVQKGSGTWAIDTNGAQTTNGTSGTGGAITGPSVTTTGSVDFCSSQVAVSGGIQNTMPSGETYVVGGFQFSPSEDTVLAGLFTSSGATAAKFLDLSSGDSYSASNMCFK